MDRKDKDDVLNSQRDAGVNGQPLAKPAVPVPPPATKPAAPPVRTLVAVPGAPVASAAPVARAVEIKPPAAKPAATPAIKPVVTPSAPPAAGRGSGSRLWRGLKVLVLVGLGMMLGAFLNDRQRDARRAQLANRASVAEAAEKEMKREFTAVEGELRDIETTLDQAIRAATALRQRLEKAQRSEKARTTSPRKRSEKAQAPGDQGPLPPWHVSHSPD